MYKKRWYDGLHDIYEGKDEFEIKFGCLIGDGGGNNGGGNDKKRIQEEQNKRADDQEPVRGGSRESSGLFNTGPVSDSVSDSVNFAPNPPQESFGSIADMDAGLRGPQNNVTQQASLTSPASLSGMGYAPDISAGKSYTNSLFDSGLTSIEDVRNQATNISPAQQNLSDYLSGGLSPGGYNAPSTGLSLGVPSGASLTNPGLQVNYTQRFAKGGAVNQGIGSVFPYPRKR